MAAHVDGNALAGVLSELFRFEPTTARGRCASCGAMAMLAEGMVYEGEQGLVLRCSSCDGVLLTVVPAGGAFRVQLRGIGWLEVQAGDEAPASSASGLRRADGQGPEPAT
jgi:hypothetical protein